MRIAIATVQTPFLRGGADHLTNGLLTALRRAGHDTEVVTMPFRFAPPAEVERSMQAWRAEDFEQLNGVPFDRVICLKFPSYYLRHPRKVVWLLHQHRTVYDLWGTPFGDPGEAELGGLRDEIHRLDREHLTEAQAVFTISRRVSERLEAANGVASTPLYHPPPHRAPPPRTALPVVFFPSRLEHHKRQGLLVEAMAHVETPMRAVLAGAGGTRPELAARIAELGIGDRVTLAGEVDETTLGECYASASCVFFAPYDEDYGYVTLEAMRAGKPVITCQDSGGTLEFVEPGRTGWVVPPSPKEIAAAIDAVGRDPALAARMGRAARDAYEALELSWDRVVQALLA